MIYPIPPRPSAPKIEHQAWHIQRLESMLCDTRAELESTRKTLKWISISAAVCIVVLFDLAFYGLLT